LQRLLRVPTGTAAAGRFATLGPMAEPTVEAEGGTLSETEYYRRLLPPHEDGHETFATLFAAFAIVLGLAALVFRPFKPGFAAILLAILALCIAGERDRLARVAFGVAGVCWLLGGVVAVLGNHAVW
jgi:hypothetical protein